MTFDEIEELLKLAERASPLTDTDRQDYVDSIQASTLTFTEWQDFLQPVPEDVKVRYRKMLKLLHQSRLIDDQIVSEEEQMMDQLSPAGLARNGRKLMQWYNEQKQIDFPNQV